MEQNSNSNSWLCSRTGLVFFGFAAIALFFPLGRTQSTHSGSSDSAEFV